MKKKQTEFTKWLGPLLDALRKLGGSGKPREVSDLIAEKMNVPDNKREETLKSGGTRFHNQVQWARQYLVWENLLDSSVRGVWSLTEKGYETKLSEKQSREIFLKWVAFHAEKRKEKETVEGEEPDDVITEPSYKEELLEILKKVSPEAFERICARLLRESGFEKVEVRGGPKDEGIDGIGVLQVNPFVSFKVLFQCKRYKGTVSRAQVGDFRNAMIGRADKGIIMTTGTFSTEARREADRDGAPPVELVDGEKLVEMFENLELGIKPKTVFEVDYTFFKQYMPEKI